VCNWTGIKQVTAPTSLPITTTDLTNNDFLKDIDFTSAEQVSLFNGKGGIISVATQRVESYLNRKLVTQDWELSFDVAPYSVYFPYGILQSVVSVNAIDDDDTVTLQAASKYHVRTGDRGRLWLTNSSTWDTSTRFEDSFRVVFRVGYTAAIPIPGPILRGIMDMITNLYESREGVDLPESVKTMIHPWKIYDSL
jgi:hypothetical protein